MASIALIFPWCVCVFKCVAPFYQWIGWQQRTCYRKTSFRWRVEQRSPIDYRCSLKSSEYFTMILTSPSAPSGSHNHRGPRSWRRRSSWAKSRRNDRTVMTSIPARLCERARFLESRPSHEGRDDKEIHYDFQIQPWIQLINPPWRSWLSFCS